MSGIRIQLSWMPLPQCFSWGWIKVSARTVLFQTLTRPKVSYSWLLMWLWQACVICFQAHSCGSLPRAASWLCSCLPSMWVISKRTREKRPREKPLSLYYLISEVTYCHLWVILFCSAFARGKSLRFGLTREAGVTAVYLRGCLPSIAIANFLTLVKIAWVIILWFIHWTIHVLYTFLCYLL